MKMYRSYNEEELWEGEGHKTDGPADVFERHTVDRLAPSSNGMSTNTTPNKRIGQAWPRWSSAFTEVKYYIFHVIALKIHV